MASDRNNDLFVMRVPEGWAVKKVGSTRAMSVFETQAAATKAAQKRLQDKGGELRVQGRDGRWRESFTLGRDAATKLNSVEGVRVSAEVEAAFRGFDRKGLTVAERRRAVERAFGKKG